MSSKEISPANRRANIRFEEIRQVEEMTPDAV